MDRSSAPRRAAVAGALLVVISFFLPWVAYQNGTFSALLYEQAGRQRDAVRHLLIFRRLTHRRR